MKRLARPSILSYGVVIVTIWGATGCGNAPTTPSAVSTIHIAAMAPGNGALLRVSKETGRVAGSYTTIAHDENLYVWTCLGVEPGTFLLSTCTGTHLTVPAGTFTGEAGVRFDDSSQRTWTLQTNYTSVILVGGDLVPLGPGTPVFADPIKLADLWSISPGRIFGIDTGPVAWYWLR